MKLEFIKDNIKDFPLVELCGALEVVPSAYHDWLGRKPSARACEDEILKQEILEIHEHSQGRFGHRLMYGQVRGRCGRDRTLRLMRSLGIVGKQEQSYRPQCTDSAHDFGYSPNLLKENGPPTGGGRSMGGRHDLPEDHRRLDVSGHGHGSPQPADRGLERLVKERHTTGLPGVGERPADPGQDEDRDHPPQRPGEHVCQRHLPEAAEPAGDAIQHERPGQLL